MATVLELFIDTSRIAEYHCNAPHATRDKIMQQDNPERIRDHVGI